MWLARNPQIDIGHEELTTLSSKESKLALTPGNIMSGFYGTRVWPLNKDALVHDMGPRECFIIDDDGEQGSEETFFFVHANIDELQREGEAIVVESFMQINSYPNDSINALLRGYAENSEGLITNQPKK